MKSALGGSTRREIQIPARWSNSSISITVNLGTFADNQAVYLYVFDSGRPANVAGFPVTLGSGLSAPRAPTGLRVLRR